MRSAVFSHVDRDGFDPILQGNLRQTLPHSGVGTDGTFVPQNPLPELRGCRGDSFSMFH
jgi:hypothetical protein